jgi:hypothetical protein
MLTMISFLFHFCAGLDPIEQYYLEKCGQNITRVRTFTKRAQGLLPKPNPAMVGHQPSEEHIDGLTAQPYWGETENEYNQFPWVARLEEQSSIIRKELENKLLAASSSSTAEQTQQASLFRGDSAWQSQVMGSGWSAIRLQRMGVWNVEFCEQNFPQTYHIVRSLNIPLAIRGVCFARQEGMSGVAPHSDGRNFILTAHLGLKIPTGCWIKVGEDDDTRNFVSRREWEEGKIILLDTSFEHSTGNPTTEDRHVLIIDFWHPELSEAEKAALSFIYDLRNQFESGKIPFRMPESKKKQKQSQGLFASIWDSFTTQDIS